MPKQADIDPAEIKAYLPPSHWSIWSRTNTASSTAWLAPGGRWPWNGPDRQSVRDAYYAQSLEAALGCYEYVVRERRPFCFAEAYMTADDWQQHEDTIYLPLSADGETVSMILVYTHCHEFRPRENWFARRSSST